MKLTPFSIEQLSKFVCGDKNCDPLQDVIWPYRTGKQLVDFFNYLGFRDVYDPKDFSRFSFAKEKLNTINEKSKMKDFFPLLLDHRYWKNIKDTVELCAEKVNEVIGTDGYQVVLHGKSYQVSDSTDRFVDTEHLSVDKPKCSYEQLIKEQHQTGMRRIEASDYAGAITLSKTLVETVCKKIIEELDPDYVNDFKDEFPKLFKRTTTLLNLDPSKSTSDTLKQILSGFFSIINGLSSLRNSHSDAHAVSHKPDKHHAKIALNAAITVSDFLFDTKNYQIKKGLINKNS